MRASVLFTPLLASSLLSGCLGADGGPEPTQSLDGGDGTNETVNTPPVADLLADVQDGTAPLNVTFTLSAGDVDGDELAWSFDAGDGETTDEGNGSALPVDVTVTYLVGTWNATFTVSDGTNETVRNLQVVVAEAQEAAGNATGGADNATAAFEPVTFTQDILLSCPHCISSDGTQDTACLAVLTDDQGLDCAFWELTPDMAGQPFVAGGTFLPIVEFYPDCSGVGRIEVGIETGTVPEGAGCAILYDLIDPVVTAVLTIG